MIDIRNRHIAVIGAARSGLAAARLLKRQGADLFVSDASEIHPEVKRSLDDLGIGWEENGHTGRTRRVDFAVVSPGVPDSAPLMKFYAEEGIPVYSEIEVAFWFNRSPLIAITGSNGKTTVTRWLEHTFEKAGRECLPAGNIGRAFCDVVDETGPDRTVILEVSSFQLDHIRTFAPDIAILLNITPDHLDRYEHQFERYEASKWRITSAQRPGSLLIVNADDPQIAARLGRLERQPVPKVISFSATAPVREGIGVRDGAIYFNNDNEELLMSTDEISLPGRHNLHNGLATALAARVSEIENDAIRESLRTFSGVEHRLELVRTLEGVRYINDSKATNINAVWFALDSYRMPIVLILGGRDKGNDYTALSDQLREKVHTIIAIGEAREAIRRQLESVVPYLLEADSMEQAVTLARQKARRGEIVMLSPACASFDMFESYEDRGETFKQAVREL